MPVDAGSTALMSKNQTTIKTKKTHATFSPHPLTPTSAQVDVLYSVLGTHALLLYLDLDWGREVGQKKHLTPDARLPS